MSQPLVSVVIPTSRRPDMIGRAVESVCRQTYPNIEILVVDDNGRNTDAQRETERVLAPWRDRVTYLVHEENKGGSAARNTGWRSAQGAYITFLDDDDEIAETKLEKQIACLEGLNEDWGACYTAYHIHMPDGSVQRSSTNKSGDVGLQALMRTFYMGSGSNVLLRKSVVDEIGGYDEEFVRNQDIEFMARAFEHCKVAYVPEDLLTIHQEVRAIRRTYQFQDEVAQFYLRKFRDRIDHLSPGERKRVLAVITLERARVAWQYREKKEAFRLLKENRVSPLHLGRYIAYLAKRVITKRSYGFYL